MPLFEKHNKYILEFSTGILLYLILAIITVIYWNGLNGPFIFDDFPNFQTLSQLDQQDTFNRIKQFVLTNDSGPTGRPVSMLSFMINDTVWPTQPWSFLYTNLMIHLLNGVLIFALTLKLCRLTKLPDQKAFAVSLLTSFLWMAHPMQVSTVLYVIQRMTELSTLFMLAGMIGYLYGRSRLTSKPVTAYVSMSASLVIFGLLAVFSKEIGILILLYTVIIEHILLRHTNLPRTRLLRTWSWVFLFIPILIIILHFLADIPNISAVYKIRPFTFSERILTEVKIMGDYLAQVIVPRLGGGGLFHDDYPISTNMFTPLDTVPYTLFTISALVIAIYTLKKKPILSFSIFWFFGGHILESTFLPIELYFEHRNYLPIFGPLMGVSYYSITCSDKLRIPVTIAITIVCASILFITYQNTLLWGNPFVSAPIYAEEHPRSIRAQQAASAAYAQLGMLDKSRFYIQKAAQYHPEEAGLMLQILQIDCARKTLEQSQIDRTVFKLKSAAHSHAAITTMISLSQFTIENKCSTLNNENMIRILVSLIENPNFKDNKSQHALYYWLGQIYANMGHLNEAIESLDKSHQHLGVIDIPLQEAVWLASAGLYKDALLYIDKARQMDNRIHNPLLIHARKRDIDNLENMIRKRQKLDQSNGTTSSH